ncbi:hypothetical protein PF010_g7268 [Phytophthora fragariae]|nr:hypothetical protein PF010_g7268 [Phytophthora fragariae]KAE9316810.1 hypothetical protein PF001_g7142 [Phytophthora fragariae]
MKPNGLKDFDVDELHLFLAKNGVAWLETSSEDVKKLQKRVMTNAIKRLMHEDDELQAGSGINTVLKGMNPPTNDQIHVLVKLSEIFIPNKRPRWTYTSTPQIMSKITIIEDVPQIDIDTDKKYVTLPATLLNACGMCSGGDLMLYRRSGVNDLWTYLKDEVLVGNKKPFIVGPSGVGKSVSTLSFAASLDRVEWSVLWIHLGVPSSCLMMRTKEYWEFTNMTGFVLPRVADEKLFVFVDGYKACDAHDKFLSYVMVQLSKENGRLVVCSAMSALGERNAEADELKNIEAFFMYSWKQEEYLEAIADDAFYASVADKLDATYEHNEVNVDDDSDEDAEDGSADDQESEKCRALALKGYYAGGSCRFMFQYTTDEVKSTLETAVHSTRNKVNMIDYCRSVFHSDTIDPLYGMLRGGVCG